ncbi:diguanylate cyclase response regulator [Geomonas limicola]|uniref:diguanylate cyclase n=1 Tax=Geomonas limicola TaxID=2740186 RepID=A0A6V8N422_9BACT|nr:diguanylate cyclase [Geomonas limicola]GFO66627.1 diguanylate cyclase response regulator [Geomonas limicola]
MQRKHPRPKILIIDDTPANIAILNETLKDEYDVYFAISGSEGLQVAVTLEPDLILLDIMMPEMDGFEVCRELKATELTARIPVIFVTAAVSHEEEVRGLQCGAADYIAKPISPPVVALRVRNHLELTRRSRMLETLSEELAGKNRQLQMLARMDGLTGLANRRFLDETLDSEVRRAQRCGTPLSLIMCDIDFFKRFNDRYGHQAGDDALRRIGALLQRVFQRGSDFPCRYGGEEFAVILPETGSEQATHLAEHLRRSMVEEGLPHAYSDVAACVTLSVGVVSANASEERKAHWFLAQADAALYRSKDEGRNLTTAVVFDP